MVSHIVMWNFKDEVAQADKEGLKDGMEHALTGLVGIVPGLLSADFIRNPLPGSTHEIALVTTFEKAADIAAYAVHPSHVEAADTYIRPYVHTRACLNY